MGLLDEAIRQHLELKRQHGASDEEVQMQEQEALGPVRREPTPAAIAPDDAESAEETDLEEGYDEAPAEPVVEDEADDQPDDELVAADLPEPSHEAFEEPADPYAEPLPGPPTELLDSDDGFEPAATGDTPARGFDSVAGAAAEDDEDVLEETPEFLQETPEHDRLWFEQKPPRDFDFDDE